MSMTLSSVSPVRNPQRPPSTPLLDPPPFLTHFQYRYQHMIHDIRDDLVLHVFGQVPPTSSKYPPSWPPLPDTLPIELSTRNFQGIFLGVKNILHDVMNDPVLHVFNQEHSTFSKYWPSWPPLPDTLLIQISARNFQGIFLGVYLNHP